MRIFLVCGKSGSGKDEVSRLIKEFYTYKLEKCVITEFSKPLKNLAKELTDWDGSVNTKPRGYLQELGDKVRSFNDMYLINCMLNNLRIYEGLTDNVVISDVRLPKEIDEIKLNYDNVYAICVENQFAQSKLTVEEQSHITETALETYDDFDYILANDNIENLKDKVFKYLEGIE